MRWNIYSGENLLKDTYARHWQQLQRKCAESNPLLDLEFLRPALKYFGNQPEPVYLAVALEAEEPTAMALVQRCGFGRWQLFNPSQLPIGPMLLSSNLNIESYVAQLNGLLAALPGWAWGITLFKQDLANSSMQEIAHKARSDVSTYATTVSVAIEGTFGDYWNARSKNLRSKIRRLVQKLDEVQGRLVVVRDGSEFAHAIAAHGRLECCGWKGRQGTAIHEDNIQGSFYRDVLRNFAVTGDACAFQLYWGDRMIASQIAIQRNGILALLKTAHDESFSNYSPGRILDYLMLQRLFAEDQIRVVEYYTNASNEDIRWSTGTREIIHLEHFRTQIVRSLVWTAREARRMVAQPLQRSLGRTSVQTVVIDLLIGCEVFVR